MKRKYNDGIKILNFIKFIFWVKIFQKVGKTTGMVL